MLDALLSMCWQEVAPFHIFLSRGRTLHHYLSSAAAFIIPGPALQHIEALLMLASIEGGRPRVCIWRHWPDGQRCTSRDCLRSGAGQAARCAVLDGSP